MAGISTHLSLARISNIPTIVSNVIVGLWLAKIAAWSNTYLLLFVSMALFYTGGMYLNDYFDAEHDRENQAFRPIPKLLIQKSLVGAIGGLMLSGGLVLLVPFEKIGLVFGLALAGVILIYDFTHKKFSGSVVLMALARMLVYVSVAVALNANIGDLYIPAVFLGFYVLGLSWLARKKERKSYTDLVAMLCLFCPILFMTGSEGLENLHAFEWVLLPAFSIWIIWCLINWQKNRMGISIGGLIAGISLLDASIIAYLGGPSIFVATCILLFCLTLILQLFVRGT